MFRNWFSLRDTCPECGIRFDRDFVDTLSFMYFSNAFLTGLLVIFMFLWTPDNIWFGRLAIVALALGLFLGTYRFRKGLAVGLYYWGEIKMNRRNSFRFRP